MCVGGYMYIFVCVGVILEGLLAWKLRSGKVKMNQMIFPEGGST